MSPKSFLAATLFTLGLAGASLAQESVRITEFAASNDSIIVDEDGTYSDWLELHNDGVDAVNLDGWYLTDDAARLNKWRIPAVTLNPGEYLIVWASDKKRAIPGSPLHTNFKLSASGEFLGLVRPDAVTVVDSYAPTFPVQVSNVTYGYGYQGGVLQPSIKRYFLGATPGAANSESAADQGPLVISVTHSPAEPLDTEDITVKATVLTSYNPVAGVTLSYRVGFNSEISIPMLDDGAHGDGGAGDAVFGASIPADASAPGEMVRWKITASDTQSFSARAPIFGDPLNSAEYFGTVVQDGVVSTLPILRWFVANPSAANNDAGTRASVFYLGKLYDNISASLKGQSSRGWPKKSYKLDFNSGDFLLYDPAKPRIEEMNVQSTWGDKSFMRMPLAWETYRNAGNAYSDSFPMQVRQNNAFFSVAIFVEEPDERYLERNGLDDDGALYKMDNSGTSGTSGVEKKNREFEDNSDLVAFIAGIQPTAPGRANFVFDNMDLAGSLNYLAATSLFNDNDHVGKNYFLYRDSTGTKEWRILPWDKDLTFGRNYNPQQGVLNDTIWADNDPYSHPLFGDSDRRKVDGPWNRVIDALYDTPKVREMYLRRLRTLMDQELQAPGTDPLELKYENRIEQLKTLLAEDVAWDQSRWGIPSYGTAQNMNTAADVIKNDFLVRRRNHLFGTHTFSGLIPPSQAPGTQVAFGTVEESPASQNQDEEYIEIQNPNATAVDISNWQMSGDVTHSFQPGTVIPAGGVLYATPKAQVFRARTSGPRAGQGLLVQGNYDGHLSETCGPVTITDSMGLVAAQMCGCAPAIQTPGDEPTCGSAPVTLTGPAGAAGYQWSTGETTESITVSPAATTSYGLRTLDEAFCPSAQARVVRTVLPDLTSTAVSFSGSKRICATCAGGTATATENGGGVITGRQWGYRTANGGPITAIAGETGPTYLFEAADFPGAGDYRLVVTSTAQCGAPIVSIETVVSINPTASISDASVTEGNSGTRNMTFTVSLSGPSSATVTVRYATANGTATTGNSDYVSRSGTLTFNPGTLTQNVSITVNGDTTAEFNETLNVNLNTPTNTTIADSQGVGTIVNDETIPTVNVNSVSVTEGNSGTKTVTFTITKSASQTSSVTVSYATENGTAIAGSDYVARTGSVTFSSGQTSKTVTVTINGDTSCEPNETFGFRLLSVTSGIANLGTALGTGTITNNDGTCG